MTFQIITSIINSQLFSGDRELIMQFFSTIQEIINMYGEWLPNNLQLRPASTAPTFMLPTVTISIDSHPIKHIIFDQFSQLQINIVKEVENYMGAYLFNIFSFKGIPMDFAIDKATNCFVNIQNLINQYVKSTINKISDSWTLSEIREYLNDSSSSSDMLESEIVNKLGIHITGVILDNLI